MIINFLLTVVDGGYTEWSLWSSCTKSCGSGSQMRTRNCTLPLPIDGGLDCADLGIGGDEESRQCNAMVCPGQIGTLWTLTLQLLSLSVTDFVLEIVYYTFSPMVVDHHLLHDSAK